MMQPDYRQHRPAAFRIQLPPDECSGRKKRRLGRRRERREERRRDEGITRKEKKGK